MIAKKDLSTDYRVTFEQLGLTGDTVTEVDANGSKGNCTTFFVTPDKNKLILYGGGTFFELDKYSNKTNSNTNISNETNQGTGTTTNRQNLIHPKNIKDINGFVQNKNQSFAVNLKSWGNVEFVSGKITSGNHIPTVFYLTKQNGDILYTLDSPFPYNVDVKAVSFEDVNKDGLKDIIIIVTQNDNNGHPIDAVWLQHANKTFTLDKTMDGMGDIKTVRNYISNQY